MLSALMNKLLIGLLAFLQKHLDKIAHVSVAYMLCSILNGLGGNWPFILVTVGLLSIGKEVVDHHYSTFDKYDLITSFIGIALFMALYNINF